MLTLENVNAYYGPSHVLHGVSLRIEDGEVVSLLGRNGAGKTTTLLSIMGYLKPRSGPYRIRATAICQALAISAFRGRASASCRRNAAYSAV